MDRRDEEVERLVEENAALRRENAELRLMIEELRQHIQRLERELEEARRAGKRQAAPFSRGKPKANPAQPGRKAGAKYGRRCRRPIPERVDRVLEAELPGRCPDCGGGVEETGVESQYQTEIPEPKVERIQFRIHCGRCQKCGRRIQGRHRRQSSDAVGGAASQVGPRAVSFAAMLNKRMGLSYGKVSEVIADLFGLQVSRGGWSQALQRVAKKAEPTYEKIVEQVRGSPSVTPDETGWKVGGRLQWMWVYSSEQATVYSIQPGRGLEQARAVLGQDYAGFLVRDGWRVYRGFRQAIHQTCLAHLLRRCREMQEVSPAETAEFPLTIKAILEAGLQLRDRYAQGQIEEHGLAVACGRLEARLDRVLELPAAAASPANRRLANHLLAERNAIFTFLHCPGLDATNYRAEQAIRPMAVTRKTWGGNRTPTGAHTQSVLASVLQTCRQQFRSAIDVFQQLLCSPQPLALDLTRPQTR
jgi:transposase